MLYSILKTSINITLVKGETETTPIYIIYAREGGTDEKFPKKYGKGKRARERHAQEKPEKDTHKKRGKHAYGNLHSTVSVPKTYGLGTKNVRFWDGKRTVLGPKT